MPTQHKEEVWPKESAIGAQKDRRQGLAQSPLLTVGKTGPARTSHLSKVPSKLRVGLNSEATSITEDSVMLLITGTVDCNLSSSNSFSSPRCALRRLTDSVMLGKMFRYQIGGVQSSSSGGHTPVL